MSWENRLTVGDLDDDNGEFENNGGDGEDIETSTDWVKARTSAEIDDEAGSGVNTYNGSTFCAKIHTATGGSPLIYIAGANLDAAFTLGEYYEISFDYKTLDCTNAKLRVLTTASANVIVDIPLTSLVWTTVKEVFQVSPDNDMNISIYSHNGSGQDGTEVLWIDNVIIKPHRKRRIISSGII